MAQYQAKNLVKGTLVSAMTDSQTTMVLSTGHGARFPATSGGQYELTIWSPSYNSAPDALNASAAEIVLVTSHDGSSDTIATVTRAQGGTSNITHAASDFVELGFTKLIYDDLVPTVAFQQIPKSPANSLWAANNPPSGYTNYDVFAMPVNLLAQAITKLSFGVSNSSFDAGAEMIVALYDSSKNLVASSGWINIDVAAAKTGTISSTYLKTGQYYLAFSLHYSVAGQFDAVSYTNGMQGLWNASTAVMGKAANVSDGTGMPATLGAISTYAFTVGFPIVMLQ